MWHGKGALWEHYEGAWRAHRLMSKTTDLHEASVPGLAGPEMKLLPASNTTDCAVTSNMSRVYRHEFVLGQKAIKLGRLKTCHVGQRVALAS